MKKAALAGIAALTLLDISASTPAGAQGIDTFVGPYIGAHTGYISGNADFTSAPYTVSSNGQSFSIPGRNDSFDTDGLVGGAHGGINFLLGPAFIGGLEGDWTWLNQNEAVSFSGTGASIPGGDGFSYQSRSELDFEWQGTIRGRLGFVAGNTLFFATAGVAFLNVDWSEVASLQSPGAGITNITVNHSKSDTLVGGAIGGGVEVAITPTIIFGADYLYENFQHFTVPHGFITAQSGKIDDIDVHKVRVRISVKLGGPPS